MQQIPEQVAEGQTINIHRSSNATTGYRWDILVSPGLIVTHADYIRGSQRGMIGAGGIQTWTIQATQSGRQYILLWYHRPWEQDNFNDADLIHVDVINNSHNNISIPLNSRPITPNTVIYPQSTAFDQRIPTPSYIPFQTHSLSNTSPMGTSPFIHNS